jgi:hypothetical protein
MYMMVKWKLLQYVSPNGRAAIADWRKSLPVGDPRADLDQFLKIMVKLKDWEYPYIDALKGKKFAGLTELRWKSGRKPHRIIGYRSNDFEYTMLAGCTHNDKKYDPPDAMETARRRKGEIKSGKALTREYQLVTDEGTPGQGIS